MTMTTLEAARNAENAAKRLRVAAEHLQNTAGALAWAAVNRKEDVVAVTAAFKRAAKRANDAVCGVNDAEMNLFTAK
jgi:hypothetical protein